MKIFIILFVLILSPLLQAKTMSARYPDYNHSATGACKDAKRHIGLKVTNECKSNVETVSAECVQCTKKVRFNTPTWTCTGKATYRCSGTSVSQDQINKKSGVMGKPIRALRGSLRKNTASGQSPCLQFPNGNACREWKAAFKSASGVRD